jgi:hypothetical protein
MYCDVVLRVLVQKLEGRCGHAGIEATNRAQVWALAAVRARYRRARRVVAETGDGFSCLVRISMQMHTVRRRAVLAERAACAACPAVDVLHAMHSCQVRVNSLGRGPSVSDQSAGRRSWPGP